MDQMATTMTSMQHIILLIILCPLVACVAQNHNNEPFLRCLSNRTSTPISTLSSIVLFPTNPLYTPTLKTRIKNLRFDTPRTPKPAMIVAPATVPQLRAAVACAKSLNLFLRIRSGGHDYEALSYASVAPKEAFTILDMYNLRSITVDLKSETAVAQVGASLGELYYAIGKRTQRLGFPAGVSPTVGVGGHISGAGYGAMMRKYGLSVDHVIDAELVDAGGALLNRKTMGEDLFWAICGGGGASFGVVLSFTLKLVEVPPKLTVFRVEKLASDGGTDAVVKFMNVAEKLDHDLFIRLLIQPVTPKKTNPPGPKKVIKTTFMSVFQGDKTRLMSIINKDFPELGLTDKDCEEWDWIHSVLYFSNFDPAVDPITVLLNRTTDVKFLKRKSDYLQTPISKKDLEALWIKMVELGGQTGLVFNQMGGRMDEIAADATPFPHRKGNIIKIQYSGNWDEEEGGDAITEKSVTEMRKLYEYTAPLVSKNPRGAYLNYRDLDIGVSRNGSYEEGEVYGKKYFMGNFERLVKVKTAVDSENFFRNEQSVPPRGLFFDDD